MQATAYSKFSVCNHFFFTPLLLLQRQNQTILNTLKAIISLLQGMWGSNILWKGRLNFTFKSLI